MDDDDFVAVSRSLEAISPVRVGDAPYAVWLIDITDSTNDRAVDVATRGVRPTNTARLHLDRDRLSNPDEIARTAAAVIRRIVTGDLPPGAVDLL